jgi:hypothetical protein
MIGTNVENELNNMICGAVFTLALQNAAEPHYPLDEYLYRFFEQSPYFSDADQVTQQIGSLSGGEIDPARSRNLASDYKSQILGTGYTVEFIRIQLQIHAAASGATVDFNAAEIDLSQYKQKLQYLHDSQVRQITRSLLWCRANVYLLNKVKFDPSLSSELVGCLSYILSLEPRSRSLTLAVVSEAINQWIRSDDVEHILRTPSTPWPGVPMVIDELRSMDGPGPAVE